MSDTEDFHTTEFKHTVRETVSETKLMSAASARDMVKQFHEAVKDAALSEVNQIFDESIKPAIYNAARDGLTNVQIVVGRGRFSGDMNIFREQLKLILTNLGYSVSIEGENNTQSATEFNVNISWIDENPSNQSVKDYAAVLKSRYCTIRY